MNCFEVKGKYNYNIYQDGYLIGDIVLLIEPLVDKVNLSYIQYVNGIKTIDYSIFLDRNNGYDLIVNTDDFKESVRFINLDCLFDNAQALFFLPYIGKNLSLIHI